MYSNNILNIQESTTIVNAHTKNVWKLIVYTSYILCHFCSCSLILCWILILKTCLNNWANHENLDLSCFFFFFKSELLRLKKKIFKVFYFLLPHPINTSFRVARILLRYTSSVVLGSHFLMNSEAVCHFFAPCLSKKMKKHCFPEILREPVAVIRAQGARIYNAYMKRQRI